MVAMALLSLIVIALMAVFSSTQTAFRAASTQSDVLEAGRNAMDLIAEDLRQMTPSGGTSNYFDSAGIFHPGAVNFFALDNSYSASLAYAPLQQSLPGSGALRINALNYFFVLGRVNASWIGVGYAVNATNADEPVSALPLLHHGEHHERPPQALYAAFAAAINGSQWTNMSHLMDGVVHLAVRAYDTNGYWMTNHQAFYAGQWNTNKNVWFSSPVNGEVGFYFFSNTVPASVEIQMGVLEDRVIQHAESIGSSLAQSNYLSQQAGKVHLFRQRVSIPNVDPSAYQ